jgi:hypothetical protein
MNNISLTALLARGRGASNYFFEKNKAKSGNITISVALKMTILSCFVITIK